MSFQPRRRSSYERWLPTWAPSLLLGLTATTERSDGLDILHWLRGPHRRRNYGFAPPRRTEPSQIEFFGWGRAAKNGYASEALTNLLHRDDARLRLILATRGSKIHQPCTRCGPWAFCVSVEHAGWDGRQVRRCRPARRLLRCLEPRRSSAAGRSARLQVLVNVQGPLRGGSGSTKGSTSPRSTTCFPAAPRERESCSCSSVGRGLAPLAPGQELPSRCSISSARPSPLPPRPRYRAHARRQPRAQLRSRSKPLPLPPAVLQTSQLDRAHGAGAFKFARIAAQPPATQLLGPNCASPRACSLGGAAGRELGMELGSFIRVAGCWALLQRDFGVGGWGAASGGASSADELSGLAVGVSPAGLGVHLGRTPSACAGLVDQCSGRWRPIRRASILLPSASGGCLRPSSGANGRNHVPLAEAFGLALGRPAISRELVGAFALLLESAPDVQVPAASPGRLLAAGEPARPLP